MELEHICVRPKQLQTEARADARFGPASDEELDKRDLVHIAGEHREKRRGGFLVLAFVEGINHNEGWDFHPLERSNDQLLHLRTKLLPSDIGVLRQDWKQLSSETWIAVSELEGEGGEDGPKVAPVVGVPRTEEAGPQLPVRETHLCERLGDGRLPRPGKAVEPEHPFVLFIPRPLFELEKDLSSSSLHASLPVSAEISGVGDVVQPTETGQLSFTLLADYYGWVDGQGGKLTMI